VKKFIKLLVSRAIKFLRKVPGGQYTFELIVKLTINQSHEIEHKGTFIKFSIPNRLTKYRADSFSTKEPETLDWIDSIPQNSILWDIGANVGVYTCYSALARKCKVFAFEPSVFNLECLARNIYLNNIVRNVTIIPCPLSNRLGIQFLNMTSTEWGGALSTFGEKYGHDGKIMDVAFEIPMLGFSMSDAINKFNIPQPEYIKMDVDGIEHLILSGGKDVIANVKGMLIEINDNFDEQASISTKLLKSAGLVMVDKKHSLEVELNLEFNSAFNQIWTRP
jgi:FkbM family methyltransferase